VGFVALVSTGFIVGVLGMVVKARRRPVVSGREGLVGREGLAPAAFTGTGSIRVDGEIWRARAAVPVAAGQKVRIMAIDGLTMVVEPVPEDCRRQTGNINDDGTVLRPSGQGGKR
jgi:membrane-bound serine protease (ClpP class)